MKKDSLLKLPSTEMLFKPEDVTIIQDGKVVGPSGIDDYDSFMQFLMMASMASNIAKIKEYFDDRTSNGYTQFWNPTITLRQRWDLTYPAQSMSLINDGPAGVWVWINSLARQRVWVANNETYDINFELHKLTRIWAESLPGPATLRVSCKD